MDEGDLTLLKKELITWIPRIIFLAFVTMIFVSLVNYYFARDLDVSGLEGFLVRERLLYGENCFSIEDEVLVSGTVDLKKFNSERINRCLKGNPFGIRLTLVTDDIVKDVVINEDTLRQLPFCVDEDNFKCYTDYRYVLVDNGTALFNGSLEMEMVKHV